MITNLYLMILSRPSEINSSLSKWVIEGFISNSLKYQSTSTISSSTEHNISKVVVTYSLLLLRILVNLHGVSVT